MSILKLPLQFVGSKGERAVYTLFDSRANLSCTDPKYLDDLEVSVSLGTTRKLSTASERLL